MRVGQARRRDAIEKPITQALRAVGYEVTPISGKGAPDVLIRRVGHPGAFPGLVWAFELKSEDGTRTKAQKVSQWPILRSVEQALSYFGIKA